MMGKQQHIVNLNGYVGNKYYFAVISFSSSDVASWDLRPNDSHILNVYRLKQFKEIHTLFMLPCIDSHLNERCIYELSCCTKLIFLSCDHSACSIDQNWPPLTWTTTTEFKDSQAHVGIWLIHLALFPKLMKECILLSETNFISNNLYKFVSWGFWILL